MNSDFRDFKLIYDFAVSQGHNQGLGLDPAMPADRAWKAYTALKSRPADVSTAPAVERFVKVPREVLAEEVPLPPYNPPERSIEDLDNDEPEGEMPFGKHKGKTFEEIKDEAPGYILWLDENVDRINLPETFVASCRPGGKPYKSDTASDIFGNANDDVDLDDQPPF